MKKILYITVNPKKEEHSYSLKLGRKFINIYKEQNPKDEIVELDLYKMDIPLIDRDVFSGWEKLSTGKDFNELSDVEKYKIQTINTFTDQFMDADKYIFVTPMWNLSFPPKMKIYIDTLMIAGKTFKYTEDGPVGLLNNKKAFHIHASGGIYSVPEAAEFEFGNSYLKKVLSFMGVKDYNSVLIEGTAVAQGDDNDLHNEAVKEIERKISEF